MQQLEDEGLVEGVDGEGRRLLRLTDAGQRYVEEHPDELAATWKPFDEGDQAESSPDLKPVIGQVMSAVWQVMISGTRQQQAEAAEILADTRRRALRPARRRGPGAVSGQQAPGPRFRTWSDLSGRSQLRIGDMEREAAVTALGEHYATGRLSKEEYDERATVAYEARTLAALQPLFADLPAAARATPAGAAAAGADRTRPPVARSWRHFPLVPGARRGPRASRSPPGEFFLLLRWLILGASGLRASSRRATRPSSRGAGHTSGSCFGGRGSWR